MHFRILDFDRDTDAIGFAQFVRESSGLQVGVDHFPSMYSLQARVRNQVVCDALTVLEGEGEGPQTVRYYVVLWSSSHQEVTNRQAGGIQRIVHGFHRKVIRNCFFLHSEYQQYGIARAMLPHEEKIFVEWGVKRVELQAMGEGRFRWMNPGWGYRLMYRDAIVEMLGEWLDVHPLHKEIVCNAEKDDGTFDWELNVPLERRKVVLFDGLVFPIVFILSLNCIDLFKEIHNDR